MNDNNRVQRYNIYPWNGPLSYRFPGKDKGINFSLPFRFGYEFNQYNEPALAIDLGYQHCMVFGKGLDGYDDSVNKFKNNATNPANINRH